MTRRGRACAASVLALAVLSASCTAIFGLDFDPTQCTGSKSPCPGACADLHSDVDNCGACGHACPGGTPCQGGVCGAGGQGPSSVSSSAGTGGSGMGGSSSAMTSTGTTATSSSSGGLVCPVGEPMPGTPCSPSDANKICGPYTLSPDGCCTGDTVKCPDGIWVVTKGTCKAGTCPGMSDVGGLNGDPCGCYGEVTCDGACSSTNMMRPQATCPGTDASAMWNVTMVSCTPNCGTLTCTQGSGGQLCIETIYSGGAPPTYQCVDDACGAGGLEGCDSTCIAALCPGGTQCNSASLTSSPNVVCQ